MDHLSFLPDIFLYLLASATLASTGCASNPALAPAGDAQFADGGPGLAASTQDVRIVAKIDEWRWNPPELDEYVTPILIELENNGDYPVRFRLNDIRLMSSPGVRLAALPPYSVEGEIERRVERQPYSYYHFYVAPYIEDYYSGLPPYEDPFAYTDSYYSTYVPIYQTYEIELPTREMLQRAMPEGVLAPGGTATGFVYFEHVDEEVADRTRRLELVFTVVNAETRERVDVLEIPYVIQQE